MTFAGLQSLGTSPCKTLLSSIILSRTDFSLAMSFLTLAGIPSRPAVELPFGFLIALIIFLFVDGNVIDAGRDHLFQNLLPSACPPSSDSTVKTAVEDSLSVPTTSSSAVDFCWFLLDQQLAYGLNSLGSFLASFVGRFSNSRLADPISCFKASRDDPICLVGRSVFRAIIRIPYLLFITEKCFDFSLKLDGMPGNIIDL